MKNVSNYNFFYLTKAFFRRFLRTEWIKVHYLTLEVDPDDLLRKMSLFDLSVKELSYDDFLKGDPDVFNDRKMNLYRKRFEDSSYKAFGLIENGILVYSGWISTVKLGLPIEKQPIFLKKEEGYLEDAYCHPQYRGRGYHTKMITYRVNELVKMGKTKIIVTVMDGNLPGLRPQYNNGFQDRGFFYIGEILGIKFVTLNKNKL